MGGWAGGRIKWVWDGGRWHWQCWCRGQPGVGKSDPGDAGCRGSWHEKINYFDSLHSIYNVHF